MRWVKGLSMFIPSRDLLDQGCNYNWMRGALLSLLAIGEKFALVSSLTIGGSRPA